MALFLQTDERELRETFGKYGEIIDVHVPTDRETGRVRGFAFLTFKDVRDCDDALAAMNGRGDRAFCFFFFS